MDKKELNGIINKLIALRDSLVFLEGLDTTEEVKENIRAGKETEYENLKTSIKVKKG